MGNFANSAFIDGGVRGFFTRQRLSLNYQFVTN